MDSFLPGGNAGGTKQKMHLMIKFWNDNDFSQAIELTGCRVRFDATLSRIHFELPLFGSLYKLCDLCNDGFFKNAPIALLHTTSAIPFLKKYNHLSLCKESSARAVSRVLLLFLTMCASSYNELRPGGLNT